MHATAELSQVNSLLWRFKLLPNRKFHDGSPFTPVGVVFSVKPAVEPTLQLVPPVGLSGVATAHED